MIHEIVGAHFRPPAKPLLAALFGDCPLELRPEPTNAYDPNAIAVYVKSSVLKEYADCDALKDLLPNFGHTLDTLLAEKEWHLGYIRKEVAVTLAPRMMGFSCPAEIAFLADGKAAASFAEEDLGIAYQEDPDAAKAQDSFFDDLPE